MAESKSHKRAKSQAAGRNEVGISRNRRIDSMSRKRATEVERSGSTLLLEKAARRLKATHKPQKVLTVPNQDIAKGVAAMRSNKVKGTVRNMSGTKRRYVSH